MTIEERKQFSGDLLKIGIDIEYRRYLQSFRQDMDYFAVVLDRDCGSHSKQLMQECLDECNQHNYGCFVTNPCFEFWLLLHLCDVKSEFSPEELESLYSNPTILKSTQKLVMKFQNVLITQKQFLQLNLKICTIPIFRKP